LTSRKTPSNLDFADSGAAPGYFLQMKITGCDFSLEAPFYVVLVAVQMTVTSSW
jgi:hypothetical protein